MAGVVAGEGRGLNVGVNAEQLRALIRESLQRQGFRVQGGQILPPHLLDKDKLRQLHAEATSHRVCGAATAFTSAITAPSTSAAAIS